jgi:hypothetical protein
MLSSDLISDWRRQVLFDLPRACREMLRTVHSLRERRRFEVINAILDEIDVREFPDDFLIDLLLVTSSRAVEYPAREGFFRRVREKIAGKHGVRKAGKLLLGLACEEAWAPRSEVG